MSHLLQLLATWTGRLMVLAFILIFAELCLRSVRIGRYHPEVRTCAWREVPAIVWQALTENRLHLLDLLPHRLRRFRRRTG